MSDTADPRTCATCPWFAPDVSGVRIVCHHASLNTANVTRDGIRPSEEWWCSSHPLRQPRTCLACLGKGIEYALLTGKQLDAGYCPTCHGTGKVIP